MWHRVLEANKKQVAIAIKSYSLKIRINSVNQILRNKEKVTETRNKNILTRIKDRKIPCVYNHVYQISYLRKIDDLDRIVLYVTPIIKNIFRVSLEREIEGKHTCFTWRGKWGKFGYVLTKKKVTLSWLMNSNMVKPEQLDHLHLVYPFTLPLKYIRNSFIYCWHWINTFMTAALLCGP